MEISETRSAAATIAWGRRFARRLGVGDCVALAGPLGAGKTVLARGIAAGMGLKDERVVSSPTFVLVQEYAASIPVYHLDLYRLVRPEAELEDLGLREMLADGLVLIEWADRAGDALPRPRWQVQIAMTAERYRTLTLERIE